MAYLCLAALAPACVAGVPTPFGDRPAACVVEVPEGSSVVETDTGVALRDASGALEHVHVPNECHEDGIVERLKQRRAQKQQSGSAASTDGWLDNKGYTYNAGYSRFTGSWNVPADPPNPRKPETLYYFFGMENLIGGPVSILQPVLTWGDESEGASGGWSVWSWACCPSSITFNSKNIGGLQEGMKVDGVIQRMDSGNWRIDTVFTDTAGQVQNTSLTAAQPYTYNWADVTLEVYNLTSCSMHSPGKVQFENLDLYGSSGNKLTPSWTGASTSSCGGRFEVQDYRTMSIQHSTSDGIAV